MIDRLPISILLLITFLVSFSLLSEEMIIGRESISPGIDIVFEAAPKDIVFPLDSFLSESETNIHIEMLANWSEDAPEGSPVGGFIAYLDVFAIISNDLGDNLKVNLSPHLNLSDNFHYAQNIKLPGSIDDTYEITFEIYPPKDTLGIHYDWKNSIGSFLPINKFTYKNLNFKKISLMTRR